MTQTMMTQTMMTQTRPSSTPQLSMKRVLDEVSTISHVVDDVLTHDNHRAIFGDELMPFFQSPTGLRVPASAVVRLALFSDCLRVVDMAVRADGRITPDEVRYVEPLVQQAMRFYASLRVDYSPYAHQDGASLEEFLAAVRADSNPFGHASQTTHWIGLDICHRVALHTGDTRARELYHSMVTRLMNEITGLGGVSHAEARERMRLERVIELRQKMQDSQIATASVADPRVRAFCTEYAPRVFDPTQHASQIWEYDPFDVDWVHDPARAVFARLIDQIDGPLPSDHGRILLLLGESGSGKTHLMRAFRNHVHAHALGYVGYMQISTHTTDYADFVLCKLIDSLERPYDPFERQASGLTRLSGILAESPGILDADALASLRDGEFERREFLHDFIRAQADRIISAPDHQDLHPDVLRALLYLQRNDPIIRSRVLQYLRCEPMSDHDRRVIGDMAPHGHGRDAPLRVLEQLGRVIGKSGTGALVLLLDQLDELAAHEQAASRLRNLFSVIRHIIDHIPTAVVVISCLDDVYETVKRSLNRSTLDRIERAPTPVRLTSTRSFDEIEAIVARRLSHLFESLDIRPHDGEELFPYRAQDLRAFTNWRTRDILDWCHEYHERCITAGQLVERTATGVPSGPEVAPASSPNEAIERAWAEFSAIHQQSPPDEDGELLALIGWAIERCSAELEPGYQTHNRPETDRLAVTAPGPDGAPESLLVAMCNHGAQRSALLKQLVALGDSAGDRRAVAVRSTPFPKSGKTRQQLGTFLRGGGRAVVVENREWRDLLTFRGFFNKYAELPGMADWRRTTRPLTRLKAIRDLLGLDDRKLVPLPTAAPPVALPEPDTSAQAVSERATEQAPNERVTVGQRPASRRAVTRPITGQQRPSLHLGQTMSLSPEPVDLLQGAVTRHVAFLGSSGSGKTTLALSAIEQLLLSDVPVIMVDRKGDLAGYAKLASQRDGANVDMANADVLAGRRAELRSRLDIRLYTPGEPAGRPLAIPVIPPGLNEMPAHERTKVTRYAASALAAMMNYRQGVAERARLGILSKAIDVLAVNRPDQPVTLDELIELIDDQDATLVAAIGRLDTKHFSKLVDDLAVLQINRGELLATTGEQLDPGELLGKTPGHAASTRLSIISTKFLGDTAGIQFWVARLLIELTRWASRHPSSRLQAALLLDEADVYLPAQSKPATKEPLQDLLKRARSAGIGVFLATQSPGDLDYRARDNVATWFLGKIAESRAIGKMKPLLSECRSNIAKKLPVQGVGEFVMVQGGNATHFRAARSALGTEQLPEHEIRTLARHLRERAPIRRPRPTRS